MLENKEQSGLLIKTSHDDYPRFYKKWEDFWKRPSIYKKNIEVANNPQDCQQIIDALEVEENLPSMDAIEEAYMADFSGKMIHPGCPMIVRGSMDCDPPEPPEYDIPDEEDFKNSLILAWADDFLDNIRKSLPFPYNGAHIDSFCLSDYTRSCILEKAEDQKMWPDNNEIFEKYAHYDRSYYDD